MTIGSNQISHLEGVIDLNAEIVNGAFQLLCPRKNCAFQRFFVHR